MRAHMRRKQILTQTKLCRTGPVPIATSLGLGTRLNSHLHFVLNRAGCSWRSIFGILFLGCSAVKMQMNWLALWLVLASIHSCRGYPWPTDCRVERFRGSPCWLTPPDNTAAGTSYFQSNGSSCITDCKMSCGALVQQRRC